MVLCELSAGLGVGDFFLTWGVLSLLGVTSVFMMSGVVFRKYYMNPTFEMWQMKSNPKYPSVDMVYEEITTTLKGIAVASFCPSLSIYLASKGQSKAYCGCCEEYSLGFQVASVAASWVACDFLEFFYHWMGHRFQFFWKFHKHHHHFYNPTPFAVIADEWVDQFVRASPMLFLPLLFPINIDIMFAQFGLFFYIYGVYLHWGYEFTWLDAHHPWINTSFQHYAHHSRSTALRPFHTGFYVKWWDNMFGTVWEKDCFCAKCEREKGNRTEEKWAEVAKPDYSPLVSLAFWSRKVKGAFK